MYSGHECLSVCLFATACPHYCTDPGVTWVSDRRYPIAVHYWADLQSAHGLCCYGNITRTRNVSEYMLVLALYLVFSERELTFTFAICYRPSVCRLSVVCLSVCLSSVTFVRPTQVVQIFGNISTVFGTLAIR